MSQPDQSNKAGATFTWVLGAFAGFAVLFIAIQTLSDSKQGFDPRAQERSDNTAEILKAQADNIAKLGLNNPATKKTVFENSLKALADKKSGVSTQVVPGSPTQLKQAAAPVPAPAAAPAPPPVPAAAAPVPAAAAPVPAATAPPPVPAAAAPAPPPVPAATTPPPAPATPAPPSIPAAPAPAPAPAVPAPVPAAPAPPK